MIDGLDRPVFYNARAISDPWPGVMLTFTFGDGDDHEHAEITMTEAEAEDLADLMMRVLGP